MFRKMLAARIILAVAALNLLLLLATLTLNLVLAFWG
ncbi:hypothetical protein N181_22215 [Sinorhizobium fredii USDA 205]|nr:hypothetical protein N181_22215 [Sinorhizobium fredii USDA 205]